MDNSPLEMSLESYFCYFPYSLEKPQNSLLYLSTQWTEREKGFKGFGMNLLPKIGDTWLLHLIFLFPQHFWLLHFLLWCPVCVVQNFSPEFLSAFYFHLLLPTTLFHFLLCSLSFSFPFNFPIFLFSRISTFLAFFSRMENGSTLMRVEEELFDLNVGPHLDPSTWAGFVLCSKMRYSNPRKNLLTGHAPPILQRPSSRSPNWLFLPALLPTLPSGQGAARPYLGSCGLKLVSSVLYSLSLSLAIREKK